MAKAPKAKAKAKKAVPAKKTAAKKPVKAKAKPKAQPKKKPVVKARAVKKPVFKKPVTKKKPAKALKKIVKAAKKVVKKVAKPAKKIAPKPIKISKAQTVPVKKVAPAKPVAAPKPVQAKPVFTPQPVIKAPKPVVMAKPAKPAVKPVIPATISASYHPTDSETYMNPTMLAFFRNQLLKWRAELEMESQEAIRELQETAAFQPDMNDQASLEYDQGFELRTRDRERKLIQKIDEALERIEDGTYGYCVETGEPIGVKRLLARPVATLSIEAKTLQEREEKGYAG